MWNTWNLGIIALFHSENDRADGKRVQDAHDKAEILGKQCGVSYAEAFFVVKYIGRNWDL